MYIYVKILMHANTLYIIISEDKYLIAFFLKNVKKQSNIKIKQECFIDLINFQIIY